MFVCVCVSNILNLLADEEAVEKLSDFIRLKEPTEAVSFFETWEPAFDPEIDSVLLASGFPAADGIVAVVESFGSSSGGGAIGSGGGPSGTSLRLVAPSSGFGAFGSSPCFSSFEPPQPIWFFCFVVCFAFGRRRQQISTFLLGEGRL